MKARDVLTDVIPGAGMAVRAASSALESTLLAQTPEGEGVYIAPDGTLSRMVGEWVDHGMSVQYLYEQVPIEEATE